MSKTDSSDTRDDSHRPKVGLALSGGGFRAAAYHLGVLKRLEETGVLSHLSIMSTVSGGSITGAAYALHCSQHGDGTPGSYSIDALIREIREVVTHNLRGEALFGGVSQVIQTALSFIPGKVRRMPLLVEELDQRLYGEASLRELPHWILINATNLATGKCWKFFHNRVGDYLVGATDRTETISVAEAVGASAAYPLLVDPYPFQSRWEWFRSDLLDNRWMRGNSNLWRRRYGKRKGKLTLPLVDGGVYDNEGLNGLRSAEVDLAIYSSTAGPNTVYQDSWLAKNLKRTAHVMHGRLGAVTRQHAHEMTHGISPDDARAELEKVATELTAIRDKLEAEDLPTRDAIRQLEKCEDQLEELTDVAWPPRGPQYKAIAPILLRNTDIAENRPASYSPPYDIPAQDRGLIPTIVRDLARVRTDLDAYSPDVVDLLIAQGYFATDAHIKVNMPKLLAALNEVDDPRYDLSPSWEWAHDVVKRANANEESTRRVLQEAAELKTLFGRS